jgi:hypothetical protein
MSLNINLDERRLEDLIERANERGRAHEVANEEERVWRRSEEAYNQKRQQENRASWYAWHLDQAERLERTAIALAEDHRAKAQKLMQEEG